MVDNVIKLYNNSVMFLNRSNKSNIIVLTLLSVFFFVTYIGVNLIKKNDLNPLKYPDSISYWYTANNLIDKGYYTERFNSGTVPTSWRPPFFAFFLSLLIRLGLNQYSVIIVNLILLQFTSYMIYYIVYRFNENKIASFFSGLLFLFSPYSLLLSMVVMSEILFVFFIVLTFFIIFHFHKKFDFKIVTVISMISFVIALYTRTVALAFLPLYVVILLSAYKNNLQKKILFIFIVFIIFHIPWTIRNYKVNDGFVFINTANSYNIFIGNVSDSSVIDEVSGIMVNQLRSKHSEREVSKILLNKSLRYILRGPSKTAIRYLRNFVLFFAHPSNNFSITGSILFMYNIMILVLVIRILIINYHEKSVYIPLFCAILLGFLHMITFVSWRFYFPVLPVLILILSRNFTQLKLLGSDK